MKKIKTMFLQSKNQCSKLINKIDEIWTKFINLKIINKLFLFLPHNLILFIFMILSFVCIIEFSKTNYNNILYNQPITDSVFEPMVVDGVKIPFKEIKVSKEPKDICITFATYAHKTDSEYKFIIYKGKEVISETPFNSNALTDGQKYCFDISMIPKEDIEVYSAEVKPVYTDLENVITIFKNSKTDEAAYMIVGETHIFTLRNIIIGMFILIFFVGNYIINTRKLSPEKVWLIVAITYLLPIMFIIPPYQVPDEPAHFYNAYRISQIDKNKSLYDNLNNPELIVPSSIECLNYSKIQIENKVSNFNEVLDCLKEEENKPNYTYARYNYINTKLGYLASSFGIKVADRATNSSLFIFYMGRLINFIISTLIIFFAIKITPKGKNLLLAVATMPMFIQQLGSYSYDTVINSLALLSIAVIIKMINSEKISWKLSTLLLIISGMFIANIKIIYITIFLLLLFIPNEKFKKKYNKYIYCFGIILLSFALGRITQAIFNNGRSVTLIETSGNVKYILENPLQIFPIAINTFKVNGQFYLRSLVGYFGWFEYHLNDIFILAYILYYIYIVKNTNLGKQKWQDKLIVILGLLISFAGIFASMYFAWSKTGLSYVDGVQGRYFIPLLIPFLLLFTLKNKEKKDNEKNTYYFINIVVIQYILTLLIFYY